MLRTASTTTGLIAGRFLLVAASIATTGLLGCAEPTKPSLPVISGETMGTQYRIVLGNTNIDAAELQQLQTDVEAELAAFNRIFSTYAPESEISRFNNFDEVSTSWPADEQLFRVVQHAADLAEDSGGAFDPTVGPLVRRWQFGPGRGQLKPPSDEEVAALRESVGINHLELSVDGQSGSAMQKDHSAVELDLSAIAKGTGVDRLCQLLVERGYSSALVDIGGELRAIGRKPDGSAWKVAVRDPSDPFNPNRQSKPAVLHDAAIATSGSYFNFHEVDGVRYSHTIDPRTGRPVTHDLVSVTVVACDCETADAHATTLMVLGPSEGYHWAASRGVAAMLIRESGESRLTGAYNAWLNTGSVTCPP